MWALVTGAAQGRGQPFQEVLLEGTYDVLTQRGALHCAARLGRLPQLELLLEAGALVDCLDGNGWTALQVRPDVQTQKICTAAQSVASLCSLQP